jgi:hypothetical protein
VRGWSGMRRRYRRIHEPDEHADSRTSTKLAGLLPNSARPTTQIEGGSFLDSRRCTVDVIGNTRDRAGFEP